MKLYPKWLQRHVGPVLFADRDLYNPTTFLKGPKLVQWACRPPAAVPSSEEGSAKLYGRHPPGYKSGYFKHITAARDTKVFV